MEYEEPLFFRVMAAADAADGDVVDMVSGNPDWGAPDALAAGLHEYADLGGTDFQYPPSEGLPALREEIAARRNVDAGRVVVTNGGGEANYLAMARALERGGSEVLLTDPVYPYYPGKTRMLGAEPRYVAAEWEAPRASDERAGGAREPPRLDPAAVRAATTDDTAAIVVNTPNNPTGAVYGEETMAGLVAAAEDHDALLVSDEVYDHFDYSGRFTSALAADSDHVVVTNSFSKSMAITGFRVGYAVFPDHLVDDAKARHMLTNVATTRPGQYAVLHALRNPERGRHERVRELVRGRIETFCDALDAAGAEYTRPEGAFYVMARFEGFPGTLENVERLIEEAGVAGMPGAGFGESREDWLRFALVTPRVEEAAERLVEYLG
jgi:aspartate aminotransferase